MIPKPMQMTPKEGDFTLLSTSRILVAAADREIQEMAQEFAEDVRRATGFPLPLSQELPSPAPSGAICLSLDGELEKLGGEGYELSVTPGSVSVRAARPQGLFYGLQTLCQLLAGKKEDTAWKLSCTEILDKPRYPWRGMMLDSSRHFMDKPFVMRMIDLLAFHKMNVLHWHFIDDNGWRMQVERYPLLTEIGAWRVCGEKRHGGFYTKDDIREILAYARRRYVTVIPEFEMPAHSNAALACYPQLTCHPKPPSQGDGSLTHFTQVTGNAIFCAGREEVFTFWENVFNEAIELFDAPYFHVGGDERPAGFWEKCPRCQERIRAEGLKDEHDLQNWFMRRITKMLAEKGKRVISWAVTRSDRYAPTDMDDLGHNAIIQNWHGGAAFAARQGWDVINSQHDFLYFDYPEHSLEGRPEWMLLLPLEKVYSFDPTPQGLSPEQASRVLGAETCLWTEFVPQEKVDLQIFPRLLAGAEIAWTPAEQKDYTDFQKRVKAHKAQLKALGVEMQEG